MARICGLYFTLEIKTRDEVSDVFQRHFDLQKATWDVRKQSLLNGRVSPACFSSTLLTVDDPHHDLYSATLKWIGLGDTCKL